MHSNTVSLFLSILFLWFITDPIEDKNYAIKILLLFLICILFSRSALILLTIFMSIILLRNAFYYKTIKHILYAWLLCASILCSITYIFLFEQKEFLLFLSRDGNIDNVYTLSHRLTLWLNLVDTANIKTFMVGNGYSVIHPEFGVDFGTGILYGAHNAYLSIFLGNGIICLVSFMIMFLYMFCKTCIKQSRFSFSFGIILSFFLSYSVFSEEFGITITPSFALLLILYTVTCIHKEHSR